MQMPLFPLRTVLYPGGLLPLKIFEQRYVAMAKACLRDSSPFGVCLITRGEEVARSAGGTPDFANVGTAATIAEWDMPQLGILHVRCRGEARFQVRSHTVRDDGLVIGEVAAIPPEPAAAIGESHARLAKLLEVLAARVGLQHLPPPHAYEDASWVGYRLAELLPLPLPIKQGMLEINDSGIRLHSLQKFLTQQGVL